MTEAHSFVLIVENVSQWATADQIEQQEVSNARENDDLKCAVARREQWQNALHAGVRLLAFLHKEWDVLQDKHLIDAEHNAKAHRDSSAWLLLSRSQDGLSEGEQDVEHNCKAEAPIYLHVGVVGKING